MSLLCLFLLCTGSLPNHVLANAKQGSVSGAIDTEQQRIRLALRSEPPSLDSAQATDYISSFVLSHLMEGLMRYGPDGQLQGGVAERWQLRADGATFWLREDARWSDGRQVSAEDFVFAWRRALAPKTASPYAFLLFPIANAKAVNAGELPPEALGVKAHGSRRLEVSFTQPCPYFLSLTAFMSYYPLRADWVAAQGRTYASEANKLIFNGPFVLQSWVHGAELSMDRNSHYWDRASVKLAGIDIPYITDDSGARFNLYKDGATAYVLLDAETLPQALKDDMPIESFSVGTVYYLGLNFRSDHASSNRCLRQAIDAVVDNALIVNKVVGLPGIKPAYSLFPQTLAALHQAHPVPAKVPSLAKAHKALACAEASLGEISSLQLLASNSIQSRRQAVFIKYLIEKALSIPVNIRHLPAKQYFAEARAGRYDLVLGGWGPDYDDPMTYGDLFASWNANNRGSYKSAAYDALVTAAQAETDVDARLALFAQMHQRLQEDVVIVPLYENAEQYVVHPQLGGVARSRFGGDPSFRFAYLKPALHTGRQQPRSQHQESAQ